MCGCHSYPFLMFNLHSQKGHYYPMPFQFLENWLTIETLVAVFYKQENIELSVVLYVHSTRKSSIISNLMH